MAERSRDESTLVEGLKANSYVGLPISTSVRAAEAKLQPELGGQTVVVAATKQAHDGAPAAGLGWVQGGRRGRE